MRTQPNPYDDVAPDDLRSERGIDYIPLRDLLRDRQWREADKATYEVMIHVVGRTSGDYFREEDLLNFPGEDLRTMDRLWVRYSQGQFGFSVQKAIYVACGARLDGQHPGDEIWDAFCHRVGWRKDGAYVYYSNLRGNPAMSPLGEFPAVVRCGMERSGWGGGALLSHRDL